MTGAHRRLGLPPREYQLLTALIRKQLLTRVWGADTNHAERVVDAHIQSIRRPSRSPVKKGVGLDSSTFPFGKS